MCTVRMRIRMVISSLPGSQLGGANIISTDTETSSLILLAMDDEERVPLAGVQSKSTQSASSTYCTPPRWLMIFILVITSVIFVFALALGIGLGLSSRESSPQNSGTYEHAAVATDAGPCSQVGVDILKLGGNAVDAAIASTLCVGVVNLHSTGIGGGGFMVYYNSSSGEAHAIDFRERAPMNASTFMYNDTAPDASTRGELAHVNLQAAIY